MDLKEAKIIFRPDSTLRKKDTLKCLENTVAIKIP